MDRSLGSSRGTHIRFDERERERLRLYTRGPLRAYQGPWAARSSVVGRWAGGRAATLLLATLCLRRGQKEGGIMGAWKQRWCWVLVMVLVVLLFSDLRGLSNTQI